MLGLLSKFLGPIIPYLLIGSIGVITGLTFLLNRANVKYDNFVMDASAKLERSASNVVTLEQLNREAEGQIASLILERGEVRVRIEQQNEYAAELLSELNEERQKNESYKTRWAKVSNGRPTLLARIANRATAARVHFFSRITCRGTSCGADGDTEDSSATTEETGSDSRS